MTTTNICLHHQTKTWHVFPVLQAGNETRALGEKSQQTHWDLEEVGQNLIRYYKGNSAISFPKEFCHRWNVWTKRPGKKFD